MPEERTVLIDYLSMATYNEETEEICCPSCGSWTPIADLTPDEHGIGHCALCRPEAEEEQ
jgi:hypothetical protein